MAEHPTYQVVLIPRLSENDSSLNALAQKFREFRLHSLQAAPDAFASTYEAESERGLEHSVARLVNPKAAHTVQLLLECEWVGMVVLLGPEEGDEFSIPSANIDPFKQMTATAPSYWSTRLFESSSDPKDIHFHINGTFVSPSTRGSRLGGALMDAALAYADTEAIRVGGHLRITLSVYGHNVAARRLYEKAGFEVVKETDSRSKPGYLAVHMQLTRGVTAA
ncbi:uncharacterized protein LTR77_006580 [Saxophila tyrrhenica]|uniref:N-acetyltransferase domain-containing protein n=1 Tax=Saxophila tyrrhenica TaxID=1690608 RepID=A0AAV9P864_9PEZI|nr:hypothetical protein LTR77_006580 [Saxophila tyrrhenica]